MKHRYERKLSIITKMLKQPKFRNGVKLRYSDLTNVSRDDIIFLRSMGLLTKRPFDASRNTIVELTDEGRTYWQHRNDRRTDLIAKSLLTPIAVSFLTTALLHLLGWK